MERHWDLVFRIPFFVFGILDSACRLHKTGHGNTAARASSRCWAMRKQPFKDLKLKAKARIWLSYMRHIRPTAPPGEDLLLAGPRALVKRWPPQGYLAHKKQPPPWNHYRSLGIGLLKVGIGLL